MALRQITTGDPPVTLDELKEQMIVETSEWDSLIEGHLVAATAYFDGPNNRLGRVLAPQVWELTLDTFPDGDIEIPALPLISVESVKYDDEDGVEQTVPSADYIVDNADEYTGRIVLAEDASWPTTSTAINSVRVRFTAGYPNTTPPPGVSGVPAPIRHAIKMLAAYWFEQRETGNAEAQSEIPFSVSKITEQYRRWPV